MGVLRRHTHTAIALSLLLATPVLAACSDDEPGHRSTSTSKTQALTALAPMEARFPELRPISAAHYADATPPSGRNDLPSQDHAYDAVLQVTPHTVQRLRQRYRLTTAHSAPDISAPVTEHLAQAAHWLRSGALDRALQKSQNAYASSQGYGGHWRLRAHVDAATGQVAMRWSTG